MMDRFVKPNELGFSLLIINMLPGCKGSDQTSYQQLDYATGSSM